MKNIDKYRDPNEWVTLTPTEWAIIYALIEGCTNVEIGLSLGLSYRTIEVYRQRMLEKTGCRNIVHLIATVFKQKLIDLEEEIFTD